MFTLKLEQFRKYRRYARQGKLAIASIILRRMIFNAGSESPSWEEKCEFAHQLRILPA